MLSVDNAFWTDRRAVASETVIAHWLLGMVLARSAHVHLGPTKSAKTSPVAHVHVHLFLVVHSACIRILTLHIKVSLAVVSHWSLRQRLLLLVRVSLALDWLLLEAGRWFYADIGRLEISWSLLLKLRHLWLTIMIVTLCLQGLLLFTFMLHREQLSSTCWIKNSRNLA